MTDSHGRQFGYLRFSLTEACNLSCTYCLPEGYPEWFKYRAKLPLGAVINLLKAFRSLGFQKVRFTGGEPTLYPKLHQAIGAASSLGFEQISLTTNGLLLRDVKSLQAAGLTSINISLDSLNPGTFEKMTGSREHHKVMGLIETARDNGLAVKINTVLLKSHNAHEFSSMVDWALNQGWELRFIELMLTKLNRDWHQDEQVPGHELQQKLVQQDLVSVKPNSAWAGPAKLWHKPGLSGRVGLINPMSCDFCASCNRLRITARGGLRLCLFSEGALPLDTDNADRAAAQVREALGAKSETHPLNRSECGDVSSFRNIGG